MSINKLFLGSIAPVFILVGTCVKVQPQHHIQPATAHGTHKELKHDKPEKPVIQKQECPAATSDGAYHEIGRDDKGAPICKFAFNNPCATNESVSATDALCVKTIKPAKAVAPVSDAPLQSDNAPDQPAPSESWGK